MSNYHKSVHREKEKPSIPVHTKVEIEEAEQKKEKRRKELSGTVKR